MRTVNSILVHANPDQVFRLAENISRWPALLPHYRWVRTLWQDGDTSVVEMAARRSGIPVKWTSVKHQSSDHRRIYYKHVDGLTRGMWVEWRFIPSGQGVHVTITHDLDLDRMIVRSGIGKWIVGHIFVKHIAGRTLEHIRTIAEALTDGT